MSLMAPGSLTSITLSPPNATVTVGQTQTLTATGKDASGTAIDGLSFTWATSDDGVATVSDGVVTGVAVGTATTPAACADTWIGTSTVIIKTPGLPSAKITRRANMTWTLDQASSGNGITAYKPTGNFSLSYDTPDPGCTITLTPSTFTIEEDPHVPATLSIIDNGVTPPSYNMVADQLVDFQRRPTAERV